MPQTPTWRGRTSTSPRPATSAARSSIAILPGLGDDESSTGGDHRLDDTRHDRDGGEAGAAADTRSPSRGLPGIVLTRPATVAWLTGGATNVIDRSASTDAMWIAVGPDDGACITTVVEEPRLNAEHELPFEVVGVPWQDPAAYRRAADRVVGPEAPADDALDDELTALRLALVPEERNAARRPRRRRHRRGGGRAARLAARRHATEP